MLSRSYFFRSGELGEVGGKIASVSLEYVGTDHVLVEGYIVRNIDWLGLLDNL